MKEVYPFRNALFDDHSLGISLDEFDWHPLELKSEQKNALSCRRSSMTIPQFLPNRKAAGSGGSQSSES